MSRIQSLSAQYRHLYEIRHIQNVVIDPESQEIKLTEYPRPFVYRICNLAGNQESQEIMVYFVEHLSMHKKMYIFAETRKVLIFADGCPENIFDLLTIDELYEILTEKQFDSKCQSIAQNSRNDYQRTTVIYSDEYY